MEHELINVLIVDDEQLVREGLKYIIDWTKLGFCICGEAGNGTDALEMMNRYKPGLVLLDIRMPGMYGTELMETARQNGYNGAFIILSGYSDFKYAQTALNCGASFYLTKPLDEDELTEAVLSVREKIESDNHMTTSRNQYLKKAKTGILYDLLTEADFNSSINYMELGLTSPIYQVVIYENYSPYFSFYNFADLLRVTNQGNNSFENIEIDNHNVIILKGNFALERFNSCLRHYAEGTQKGSPLDSVFLTYGPTVSSLSQIHGSYEICRKLMERRFFCDENQHVLSYDMLPDETAYSSIVDTDAAQYYSKQLIDYIKIGHYGKIGKVLSDLKERLYTAGDSVSSIKYFLADIFLQVKQSIMHTYSNSDIPFAHNAAIIELIENKFYLYEILLYFSEQFEVIIRTIGSQSGDNVFDDLVGYIDNNYPQPLKLETLAPLFGYNSSYLGKLFYQKMGQNFNSYLDKVRIQHAIDLLKNTDMKVYEIAANVGYKNVDYFHIKFKKHMNLSPAEYRSKSGSEC